MNLNETFSCDKWDKWDLWDSKKVISPSRFRLSLIAAFALLFAPLCCKSLEINVFPDGDFENNGVSYRAIGDARGSVRFDETIKHGGKQSLKVENASGGDIRAYSGHVISLGQLKPQPLKVSFSAMRRGGGKTLAAIDLVIVDADGKRSYWFEGLSVDGDTGGEWVRRESVYNPSKPIKSVEVWPIVNGDPCTVWFDDVAVVTDVAAQAPSGRTFDISSGDVKLSFLDSDGKLSLSSLKLFSCDFIRRNGIRKAKNLWRISFRLPDTRCVSVDSGSVDSMERTGDNLWTLHWKDLEIPSSKSRFGVDVVVKIREDGVEWRINVDGGEDVLSVAFPCISGIGPLGEDGTDDFLALPKNSGILMRDYSTVGTENLTYGAGASMQCAAFYDKNGGLYLSSCDSGMHAKLYSVSRQLDNSLAYSLETVPSGSIKGRRRYEQPFAFEMLFFNGDWFDAAELYRRWALKQPWCEGGRLSERPNPALFDCDVWTGGGSVDEERYAYPERNTAAIAKFTPEERLKLAGKISTRGTGDMFVALRKAIAPAGSGIFFSDNWHCFGCLGICAGNPEYQARRGFAELVSMMNSNGIRLLPYTNFGRWDVLMDGYDESIMIRRADMSVLKHPANGTEQAAVCHGTSAAEALWRSMAKQISGYGCPGIYLDELSTNGNPVCYSEGHDHAPGDGSAKIRAQRKNVLALKEAVKDANPNFFTMGEQGCETYIGVNDINLWWLVSQGDRDIPFFDAVYHDYTVSMCRIPGKWYGAHVERDYQDKSGETGLEELALALGKCFVQGLQIGLVRDDFVAYSKRGTAMLAEAAKLRRKLHPYLLFGTMRRAPEVIYPIAKVPVRQGFAGFATTPSAPILTGAFEADDGSMADVFFNITDKPQKVFWRTSVLSKQPARFSLALMTAAEEQRPLGVVPVGELDKRTFELSLPPFGCAAVVLRHTEEEPTKGFGFSVPPEGGLTANATPRSAAIKAGDIVFIDLQISNPSNSDYEISLNWTLPNGWRLVDAPKGLIVASGAERRLTVSLESVALTAGAVDLGLEIAAGGDWRKSFGWRMEVAPPRRKITVHPATAKTIEAMRRCEALPSGEEILLVQPRRRNAALDGIAAVGRAAYDRNGLYFLFRIDGVPKPVKAMHSDYMWNGCCMQMTFNGLRLNQPYAISLCMADTAEGNAVYDFMGGEMLKNPDFNFRSDGKSIFYFFSLPWSELGHAAPPVGKRVSFSATYNHNDGEKFAGYLEWTPGICDGTNPNEYGDLIIAGAE